jgi:hypothetical protein
MRAISENENLSRIKNKRRLVQSLHFIYPGNWNLDPGT